MFNWFSFLTYAVTTTFTPGPNTITTMTIAGRRGFKGAMPFIFGVVTGFGVVMVLCTLFCTVLSAWVPRIQFPMLVVGAAYMLHLAWGTFRSTGLSRQEEKTGFLAGVLLQFVNVKVILYGILSMQAYIIPHFQGNWPALVFFALVLTFIGFLGNLCWAMFGSLFQSLFTRHARVVNPILALLLVYCAVSLFL